MNPSSWFLFAKPSPSPASTSLRSVQLEKVECPSLSLQGIGTRRGISLLGAGSQKLVLTKKLR